MHSIEIDFDVFKALTIRRETEATTYNDVLRRALGLDRTGGKNVAPNSSKQADRGWRTKGVYFPTGTEFRARYDGQVRTARVVESGLDVDGRVAPSPSRAARFITGTSVNGWDFWECRLPGDTTWRSIKTLREQQQDDDPFSTFTEWASEADEAAYGRL